MLFNKKNKKKLIITCVTYVFFVFIFTKIPFFHISIRNITKIDWVKVLLVAIIPAGLVLYLSDSFIEKNGQLNFYTDINSDIFNEDVFQNNK